MRLRVVLSIEPAARPEHDACDSLEAHVTEQIPLGSDAADSTVRATAGPFASSRVREALG